MLIKGSSILKRSDQETLHVFQWKSAAPSVIQSWHKIKPKSDQASRTTNLQGTRSRGTCEVIPQGYNQRNPNYGDCTGQMTQFPEQTNCKEKKRWQGNL